MSPSPGKMIMRGLGLSKKKKKQHPQHHHPAASDNDVSADADVDQPDTPSSFNHAVPVQEVPLGAQYALRKDEVGVKWDSGVLHIGDEPFEACEPDSAWEEIELEAATASSRRSIASSDITDHSDTASQQSTTPSHADRDPPIERVPTARLRVLFSQNSVMAKTSESSSITVGRLDIADFAEKDSFKALVKFRGHTLDNPNVQNWDEDDGDSHLAFRCELAGFLTIRHPDPDHILITLHGAKPLPVLVFPAARIVQSFLAMLRELLVIHPSPADPNLLIVEREIDRSIPGSASSKDKRLFVSAATTSSAAQSAICSIADSMLSCEIPPNTVRRQGTPQTSPMSPYSGTLDGPPVASVDIRKPKALDQIGYDSNVLSVSSVDHLDGRVGVSKKTKQKHDKNLNRSRYRYLFYPARWLTAYENLPTAPIPDYEPTNFRPAERRGTPVSAAAWAAACKESTGEIRDPAALLQAIFEGGLETTARSIAWPFLLQVYAMDSTENYRQKRREEMSIQYATVKQQWMAISAELEESRRRKKSQNVDLKKFERLLSAVSVDIGRVDFQRLLKTGSLDEPGENQESTGTSCSTIPTNYDQTSYERKLKSVLICTYFHNSGWIYPEGIANCLFPILCVFQGDEVMSYWCFLGLLRTKMNRSFLEGEAGPKTSLLSLRRVIEWLDPQLSEYFSESDPTFLSCLRWILMHMSLDLKPQDLPLLWETCWTRVVGGNSFILFACAGVLLRHRIQILKLERNLSAIMRFVKDLRGRIDGQVAIHDGIEVFREVVAGDLRRKRSADDHRHNTNEPNRPGRVQGSGLK